MLPLSFEELVHWSTSEDALAYKSVRDSVPRLSVGPKDRVRCIGAKKTAELCSGPHSRGRCPCTGIKLSDRLLAVSGRCR